MNAREAYILDHGNGPDPLRKLRLGAGEHAFQTHR